MLVKKLADLQESGLFKEASTLLGTSNFADFEQLYDDKIFYADGEENSVKEAMKEEFHAKPFECIFFDGWFIALLATV